MRPQAEKRPPMRSAQASGSTGAPKEGARPPAAGGVGGASGDMPTPTGLEEPGRLSSALSWARAKLAKKSPAASVAAVVAGRLGRRHMVLVFIECIASDRLELDAGGVVGRHASRR
jgi:hypothetical protein